MKRNREGELSTAARIEQFEGKLAVLKTWEAASEYLQIKEHDYLVELKKRVRLVRNYVTHRADPEANL